MYLVLIIVPCGLSSCVVLLILERERERDREREREREREMLRNLSVVRFSSSRCHGLVGDMCFWNFLLILLDFSM